jgi:DNA-binding winged helix-turn-helix (wHTH) protein
MPPQATNSRGYEFGPFKLICGDGLFADDKLVYLAPKEFGVLESLVRRAGSIATKDELIQEVWHDPAISDESLTRCVYILRKAMAEFTPDLTIETLHRRGYRFAMAVRSLADELAVPPHAPQFDTVDHAHEYFQHGLSRLAFRSAGDLEQAYQCFRRAIEFDPGYVLAYGGLIEAMIVQVSHGWVTSASVGKTLRQILDQSLQIDPSQATLHALSAFVLGSFEWNWPAAWAEFAVAQQLDATSADVQFLHGFLLACQGKHRDASEQFRRAAESGPYSPHYRDLLIWTTFHDGQPAAALAESRLAMQLMPSVPTILSSHALMASYNDLHDEAIAVSERCAALGGNEPFSLMAICTTLFRAGREAEARRKYDDMLSRLSERSSLWSQMAPVVLMLEGEERGLAAIEQSCANHCHLLPFKMFDPQLAKLRDTPRFRQVFANVFQQTV